MTDAERLAALQTAIDGFISGGMMQSYTADGITVTKANFDQMRRYEKEVEAKVARTKLRGVQFAELRGSS